MKRILLRIKEICASLIPWRIYYIHRFKQEKKRYPRILHPKDYSDYIFRDNILGRHNVHAYLADKIEVRNYVEQRGLGFTLTKIFGVWKNAKDIDFNQLPDKFAIKCNHSCKTNIICLDKSRLDISLTREQLNRWLKMKHRNRFEQHYRKISPRIFCEELIPFMPDGSFPIDYKIHCANGVPIFIQVCFERTSDNVGLREIYSPEWKNLHLVKQDYHYSERNIPKPQHLAEMLVASSKLSEGLEYARIDFYDTPDRIIFGEITLTPMGGWLSYFKQEALDYMGEQIRKYN